jgi:hypothetical protein
MSVLAVGRIKAVRRPHRGKYVDQLPHDLAGHGGPDRLGCPTPPGVIDSSKAPFILGPDHNRARVPWVSLLEESLDAGGSFFKHLLLGRTGLQVARSRYPLAPLRAPEDPIPGGLSDLMANDCLQSCFDREPRAHLAHLTLLQKVLYPSPLLFQAEVSMLPLPSTRSLQRAGPGAIVGRH